MQDNITVALTAVGSIDADVSVTAVFVAGAFLPVAGVFRLGSLLLRKQLLDLALDHLRNTLFNLSPPPPRVGDEFLLALLYFGLPSVPARGALIPS